jgi:hypothetical protein
MMGGVPLETRWAFNKLWNNKCYYNAASCWYFYWVIYDTWIYEYQICKSTLYENAEISGFVKPVDGSKYA